MVYEAIIRAIRDYFVLFVDANGVLEQTIHRENQVINRSVDDELDFGDFNNEIIEPPEIGDINKLIVPTNTTYITTIQSASILEESAAHSAVTYSAETESTASTASPQMKNYLLLFSEINNCFNILHQTEKIH